MRDDEIRRHLTQVNPWWQAAVSGQSPTVWAASHRVLQDLRTYDMGYRPDVLDDIAEGPLAGQLVVLSGPRRVGKSVALLQCIERLCQRDDIDPRQIIHVPCDGLTAKDLRRVLVIGKALTSSIDGEGVRRRVWLFDEIGAISDWSAVLKGARDNTPFGEDTVVATGSRWSDSEDIEGHLLAGRAGHGTRRRRVLLPMSFREYLAVTRPQLPRLSAMHPADLQSAQAGKDLEKFAFLVDDYDLAWQAFLTTGGFPRAVSEYAKTGAVSDGYLADLEAWLHRDVEPSAGQESMPLLLEALAHRSTSPLNINATAIDLGYSKTAFDLRLRRLTACSALLRCPQRDEGRLVPRTQAKYYLTDPLLAWLPSRQRAGIDSPDMTQLSEAALGVALARAIDNLQEGRWLGGDTIGYYRTTGQREIDFAPVQVPSDGGPVFTTPMESKWVDRSWKAEARTLVGRYGTGIIATKTVLDLSGSVWAVPAPMLATVLL